MSDDFYQALATWSQVVGSLAFIVALVWLFVKFIRPALESAQAQRNAQLAEAERERDEAKAQVAVAQAELAAAEGEVRAIAARAAADAAREHERIVGEAKAEGERRIRNADGELARARTAAREALRGDLVAKALEIARASAAKIDAPTNAKIVGGVVETIERGGAAN